MLTGGCLCGSVRYEIDGSLRHITHCHCSMCRKAHGAAFATYARLARRRFRLVSGTETLAQYRSSKSVSRQFCRACGSQLLWLHDDFPEVVSVALGTLQGDPGGRPEAHIYAGNRAEWLEIHDDLPRYEADAPIPSG